ncbi:hypothetical protein [Roseateles sp.]|uniref:hypothetical protein n=1 Tax=Roseateles sp. TaxID=1971397 RepID=UPI0031DADCA8
MALNFEDDVDRVDDIDEVEKVAPAPHQLEYQLREELAMDQSANAYASMLWLRHQRRNGELDARGHLDQLLAVMGDADLSSTRRTARLYLHELSTLKAGMTRLPFLPARRWPENMVAVALASTRPASMTRTLWFEDAERAGAIQRWISRVTQFAAHDLIRSDRCAGLLLDVASGLPLPHKALQQGNTAFSEFGAVMDGYVAAAQAGVITHGDLVSLFQAPVPRHAGDGSAPVRQTLLGALQEESHSVALALFKGAARSAHDCGALTGAEFQRVISEQTVPLPTAPTPRK